MANRVLAGLMVMAFCSIIALPVYAQDPSTPEKKGRAPGMRIIGAATAQDTITPEKKALIKELFGLINAYNNSEAISNQIMDQLQGLVASQFSNEMRGWIQAQKSPPAEQKRLEAIVDETIQRILTRIRAEVPKRVNYSELVEKIGVEIYNKHFTEAELKELIAFNKTPTAQKFVKIRPQIIAEMMSGVEKFLAPEIIPLINEIIDSELIKLIPKRN